MCHLSSSLKAFDSQLYSEYSQSKSKKNWKTYLHQKRIQEYDDLNCVLYTKTQKRPGKTDVVYEIVDRTTFRRAVVWRISKMAYQKGMDRTDKEKIVSCKCSHCNVEFHQSHVNTCPMIQNHPLIKDKANRDTFLRVKKKLLKDFPKATHFSIMDFWLNGKHFDQFNQVYIFIESLLLKRFSTNQNHTHRD